jgi:hypothetical protein
VNRGTRIQIEKPQQWDIVEVLDLIPDCILYTGQAELRAELEVLHGKIYDYVLKESPDITVEELYRQCAEGCWGWLDIKCRTGKWNQLAGDMLIMLALFIVALIVYDSVKKNTGKRKRR